jgi:hypothetical protein
LDELGCLQLDAAEPSSSEVLTEREENASIGIASNEPFSGWAQDLHRPAACAAIVDRLTFNGPSRNRHHQLPIRPRMIESPP